MEDRSRIYLFDDRRALDLIPDPQSVPVVHVALDKPGGLGEEDLLPSLDGITGILPSVESRLELRPGNQARRHEPEVDDFDGFTPHRMSVCLLMFSIEV